MDNECIADGRMWYLNISAWSKPRHDKINCNLPPPARARKSLLLLTYGALYINNSILVHPQASVFSKVPTNPKPPRTKQSRRNGGYCCIYIPGSLFLHTDDVAQPCPQTNRKMRRGADRHVDAANASKSHSSSSNNSSSGSGSSSSM